MTPDKTNRESRKLTSPQAKAPDLARYQCGPLCIDNTDSYDCHVVFDHAVSLEKATHRERPRISTNQSRVAAFVIKSDENAIIARHTQALCDIG